MFLDKCHEVEHLLWGVFLIQNVLVRLLVILSKVCNLNYQATNGLNYSLLHLNYFLDELQQGIFLLVHLQHLKFLNVAILV